MKYSLTIELVPATSWYSNVRSNVTKKEWDNIRRTSYRKAQYVCEICGDSGKNQGFKHPVECHEIWEYDEKNSIQKLAGMISLCPRCHKVKHAGLSFERGEIEVVLEHLQKVNGIKRRQAQQLFSDTMLQWETRSKKKWKVDISYLEDFYDYVTDRKILVKFRDSKQPTQLKIFK